MVFSFDHHQLSIQLAACLNFDSFNVVENKLSKKDFIAGPSNLSILRAVLSTLLERDHQALSSIELKSSDPIGLQQIHSFKSIFRSGLLNQASCNTLIFSQSE
jgi:hypothetical protein